jgi:hypothetical protein
MKIPPESFKGIEFVRISSLPGDQKEKIWNSLQHDKIIKIVKDQSLLNDCVLYQDYLSWFNQQPSEFAATNTTTSSRQPFFTRLAFK